ncbi:MAG: hypothetical protein ABIT38_04375 [Gemmatimonadaceae bacterium]
MNVSQSSTGSIEALPACDRVPQLLLTLRHRAAEIVDAPDKELLNVAAAALERALEKQRIAEQQLCDREHQVDLLEQIAAIGSWEIDILTDGIRWSR